MNQKHIDQHKEIVYNFDGRIAELQYRLDKMREARQSFMESVVNYELNCADAEHRVCCGSKPRQLAFGSWECGGSPIGTCVYLNDKDPAHDHCTFCNEPEERK